MIEFSYVSMYIYVNYLIELIGLNSYRIFMFTLARMTLFIYPTEREVLGRVKQKPMLVSRPAMLYTPKKK